LIEVATGEGYPLRRVIWFSFFVVILTTVSDLRSAASAKVIRLEIASKAYYGSFTMSSGKVGSSENFHRAN
jgi:hypothetical protein